jgi:hypothetical protein
MYFIFIFVLYLDYFNVKMMKYTLVNTEEVIKNGQSRETGNIGYTTRRQTKQNVICVGHHYAQANTK